MRLTIYTIIFTRLTIYTIYITYYNICDLLRSSISINVNFAFDVFRLILVSGDLNFSNVVAITTTARKKQY